MLPMRMEKMATMIEIPRSQLGESLTDALLHLELEAFNQKLTLDYFINSITLDNAHAIAGPFHRPSIVGATVIDNVSGNADRPYRL